MLLVAGCGSSTVHRRPSRTEIYLGNQHVIHLERWVVRAVKGSTFMVPARIDPVAVDFIRTTAVDVRPKPPFPTTTTPPSIDASTTAVIDRPNRIEIVATGSPGQLVEIGWEETCGFHQDGPGPSEAGGVGGEGQQRARLPAVLTLTLPRWSTGEDRCYLASTLMTNKFKRGLALDLVNF